MAAPQALADEDRYPGSLYVERDARVTARRSGVIEAVLVDRGAVVRAGQPLAVLETDLPTHELEMAEQELRLADSEYERSARLHDERIVSPQDFQRVEIARDLARSKVALARSRLDLCTVRAPFDGLVVERWAVVGQRVQEDDNTPLFRVTAHESLRARVNLPEDRLGGVTVGARARIEAPGDAEPHPARVVFVGPAVDPASGTVPVIVETLGSHGPLRLGGSIHVRFEVRTANRPPRLLVPRDALPPGASAAGDRVTLLVSRGGRAEVRRVSLLGFDGDGVIVSGELGPDDRVILGASGAVRQGAPIVARPEDP